MLGLQKTRGGSFRSYTPLQSHSFSDCQTHKIKINLTTLLSPWSFTTKAKEIKDLKQCYMPKSKAELC